MVFKPLSNRLEKRQSFNAKAPVSIMNNYLNKGHKYEIM